MAKNAYVGVDNKARKVKNIYVGVDTQVPIYEEKQITFSRENINEFFTVQNNSAYPFEINPSTTNQVGFVPGNIGVNSSTSQDHTYSKSGNCTQKDLCSILYGTSI